MIHVRNSQEGFVDSNYSISFSVPHARNQFWGSWDNKELQVARQNPEEDYKAGDKQQ